MKDNLCNFNASQREAICHGAGPALVLAGPGSGKTTVLTRRLKYLIDTLHIPPEVILVVTFTKAAAREMQQRFQALMETELPVRFGTFHAIYYHILREYSGNKPLTLIQETEQLSCLRQILCHEQIQTDLAPSFLEVIGRLKNGRTQEGPSPIETVSWEQIGQVFQMFRQRCQEMGKLDFDDMAYECLQLFEKRPDVLRTWQKRCRYILADEYQDVSPIQEQLLSVLALPENNLFLVGDDDQSIYGFRGAGPESMLSFPDKYPNARQIILETNYRCRPGIIETAGKSIAENKYRFNKKQIPARESSGVQEVICRGFTDRDRENQEILNLLQDLKRRGSLLGTAVLFRKHADGQALAGLLERFRIPCIRAEQGKTIAGHFVTEDITAYLRLISGDRTRKNFYRIMNRPVRGIARESCREEQVDFYGLRAYHSMETDVMNQILRLEQDCLRAKGMSLYAAVMYIRKRMGYETWLQSQYQGRALEAHRTVLLRLQELAGQTENLSQWEKNLEQDTRKAGKTARAENPGEGVRFMTFHSSKGLEFDHVIMPDLNEGTVPHKKASTEKELEEERRMFYVGMTRARERLYLFYTTGTKEEPETPSRFLKILL